MSLLGIFSILASGIKAIKEAAAPSIPAENWENQELYHKDLMSGMSGKELMKNVENGKYKLTEKYPEPHRDKDGKIIIENCLLYDEDLKKYGAVQVGKWIKQGRYNLTPEELKKENERINKELERLYSLCGRESDEQKKQWLEKQARKEAELQQKKKIEQPRAVRYGPEIFWRPGRNRHGYNG